MEDSNNPVEERLNASMSASGSSFMTFMKSDSLGNWLVTILLFGIPLINIIYFIMLLIGVGGSVAKINMARATLIWLVITAVAYIGFFASLFAGGYQ